METGTQTNGKKEHLNQIHKRKNELFEKQILIEKTNYSVKMKSFQGQTAVVVATANILRKIMCSIELDFVYTYTPL